MKKLSVLLCLLFITLCAKAQEENVNQPPYKRFPENVPLKILLTDSTTWFTQQDFAKKKPVMVMLFSPDCSHCQHEIPHLQKLYTDSLKAMNVGVFAVSTEQTDSSFRAFAAKNCVKDPNWITCADMRGQSAFRREYDVIATPKVYLVAPDFKILAKNIPLNNLVDFVEFQNSISTKKGAKE